MAKIRVAVLGTIGKSVLIDDTLPARVAALEALVANLNTGGVTAHSALSGLKTGDDHPQYPLKLWRETIRGQWDFTEQVWASDGTEALPGYAFTAHTGSGFRAEGETGDPYFESVGLLLHCDGTNGSTSFPDSSNYANAVTAGGATVTTTNPKFGTGAMNQTGASHASVAVTAGGPLDIGAGDFTIEGWARLTNIASVQAMFGFGDGAGGNIFRLYSTNGQVTVQATFVYGPGTDISTPGVVLSNDTWFHWAVVRSGTAGYLFVNGVRYAASSPWSGSPSFTSQLFLGSSRNFGSQFEMTGALDEVRVTKGVARYTADFTPPIAAFPDFGSLGFVSVSVSGDEKFRFGASGQFGIGGAVYGSSGDLMVSSGASSAPSWLSTIPGVKNWTGLQKFTASGGTQLLTGTTTVNANPSGGTDLAHLVDIVNDATAYQVVRISTYGAPGSIGGQNNYHWQRARGTLASPTAIKSGDTFMSMGYRGHNGTAITGSVAAFAAVATEDWTGTANGIKFTFQATANGSTTRTDSAELSAQGVGLIPGTLSLPGLYFAVDTNLGVYRSAADTLGLAATSGVVIPGTGVRVLSGDGTGTAFHAFNGAAGNLRGDIARTNGTNRWLWGANDVAESGSNAGSDFSFFPFNDAGSIQNEALRIVRSSGFIRVPNDTQELQLGASQDLRLLHDGTNSFIRNDTGGLRLTFSTNVRFEVNTTGVGFNGVTPIARPDYTITNPTTNRSIDVSAITHAQLAQVVGTMIQDLINYGLYQ